MAKLHFPRKNISLDMTAMCDVAFLLLTFFMLATKFRPDEPVIVDTPSSVSEIKLPESDVITLTVSGDGAVFFGIDNLNTRLELIDAIGEKYQISFTPEEQQAFVLTSAVGVPIGNLKQLLNTPPGDRKSLHQPGIPTDSTGNELLDWIDLARHLNDRVPRVAIKGDQEASYAVIKEVIGTLQELNINRFNMITSLEARPGEAAAPAGEAAE